METDILIKAGLTQGESKVYLALLGLGSTTIGPILQKSQVTKSIIYRILDKLIEKGLVSYIFHDKTKHFQAEQPEKILEFLEKQESDLQKTKKSVAKLIPELKMHQALTKTSTANLFEGFKGLLSAYEKRYDKLKKGDEVVIYGLPPTQPAHHHAYWKKTNQRLDELGIKSRLLYAHDATDEVLKNRNDNKLCQARRLPKGINSPSWVMTYHDTTLIAIPQGDKPIAIEIVNQEITNSFQSYFEALWTQSKEFVSPS